LAGGEEALLKRQAEIDAAGAKLQQRLDAARQQQEDFNQRRTAWLESNRPQVPQVPELVLKLQKVGKMDRIEAARYMNELENDELYDFYSPLDGYTDDAQALLAKYADVAGKTKEVQRWKRIVEPPTPFKPPEM
jgi:hypothetical protein